MSKFLLNCYKGSLEFCMKRLMPCKKGFKHIYDMFRSVFMITTIFLRDSLWCDECRCVIPAGLHFFIASKEFLNTVSWWIIYLEVYIKTTTALDIAPSVLAFVHILNLSIITKSSAARQSNDMSVMIQF